METAATGEAEDGNRGYAGIAREDGRQGQVTGIEAGCGVDTRRDGIDR